MVYNPEAYNFYEEMLKLRPKLDFSKGCAAEMNYVFVRDAIFFAALKPANPFESGSPASDAFNDLLYFYDYTNKNLSDCPFKMRCARAALEMLNLYEGNPYTDREEEPAAGVEDTDGDKIVAEAAEPEPETVVQEPAEKVLGVVPEKKQHLFGRRRR